MTILKATFTLAMRIFKNVELLYLFAPNLPAQQRVTIFGALAAAVTWLALSWGLGFFFQHFGGKKLDRSYEYLATPIAVMVWLYWSAFALLMGAEINSSLQSYKSSGVGPKEVAQPRKDAA